MISTHIEIDSHLVSLLEKYRDEPKIKHKSLKCLFTGPPRVGKTTLKNRLLKVIKNLITSGVVSPSGGLEKPISVVIGETRECVTVVMESDVDWQPQEDLLDEAQIVLEFIDHQPTTQDQDPSTKAPATNAPATNAPPRQVAPTCSSGCLPSQVPPTRRRCRWCLCCVSCLMQTSASGEEPLTSSGTHDFKSEMMYHKPQLPCSVLPCS